ncbi:MAG: CAP domain-containing protein [Erythrobacter sp.]
MIRKATFTLAFAGAASLAALPLLPSQADGAKAHPVAKPAQDADDKSKLSRIMAAALADKEKGVAPQQENTQPADYTTNSNGLGPVAAELLAAHNGERKAVGVPELTWNADLAADAKVWADELAKRDKMQHASKEGRKGVGENLWAGTTGRFSPTRMINAFIREKQYFKPGLFPEVTTTDNWGDVGHYTQLIWPDTKEIGCAITGNGKTDYLVCRYKPSGNWRGEPVGM